MRGRGGTSIKARLADPKTCLAASSKSLIIELLARDGLKHLKKYVVGTVKNLGCDYSGGLHKSRRGARATRAARWARARRRGRKLARLRGRKKNGGGGHPQKYARGNYITNKAGKTLCGGYLSGA